MIAVEPATADRWDDVVTAFGPRLGKPNSCWCQRFRRHDQADNRAALEHEVRESPVPVGLVAYVDGDPAAWTRVVPRDSLPGICENRAIRRLLDDDADAWWVTCVVVRRDHRGHGVGTELLRAAVDFARDHEATVLDGHPVDVEGLTGTPSASALFTGTMSMYTAAGFAEIGRTYPTRPVMRHQF